MPVKVPLSPESFAHQPRTPTPSAPVQKSSRSISPQRPLLNRSPLPAFKLRFSNLAVILGATDVSYPMGGEAQARIPAPGLSPLRVSFSLTSLSLSVCPRLRSEGFHVAAAFGLLLIHADVLVTKRTYWS